MGKGGIAPLIVEFRHQVECVVKFRYRLFSFSKKQPPVLQNRRLGQPQNWSGSFGVCINFLPLLGIKPIVGVVGYKACSISTLLSTLSDCHAGVIGKTSQRNIFEKNLCIKLRHTCFAQQNSSWFQESSTEVSEYPRIIMLCVYFLVFCIFSAGLY